MKKLTAWLGSTPLGWPVIVLAVTGFTAYSLLMQSIGYRRIVDQDNLENLLSGTTLRADSFWFRYDADGNATGFVSRVRDNGIWYATDDHYCEQWQVWGDGEERCWLVERSGDIVRRTGVQDASAINLMTVVKR